MINRRSTVGNYPRWKRFPKRRLGGISRPESHEKPGETCKARVKQKVFGFWGENLNRFYCFNIQEKFWHENEIIAKFLDNVYALGWLDGREA